MICVSVSKCSSRQRVKKLTHAQWIASIQVLVVLDITKVTSNTDGLGIGTRVEVRETNQDGPVSSMGFGGVVADNTLTTSRLDKGLRLRRRYQQVLEE